jgi:hypothetical protein
MNRAQGNTRSLPDGFLHIQNFTVTKHAGLAGVVYIHILNVDQQAVVQELLRERAVSDWAHGGYQGDAPVHYKHGQWRFSKAFLKKRFQPMVHRATALMAIPVIQTFTDELITEREALKV